MPQRIFHNIWTPSLPKLPSTAASEIFEEGSGVRAQLVKCLLYEPKDLYSDAQHLCCKRQMWRGRKQENPWGLLASCISVINELSVKWETLPLRIRQRGTEKDPTAHLWSLYARSYIDIHIPTTDSPQWTTQEFVPARYERKEEGIEGRASVRWARNEAIRMRRRWGEEMQPKTAAFSLYYIFLQLLATD